MMKKENIWKTAISGILVLTLTATGIALYQTGKEDTPKEQQEELQLVQNPSEEQEESKDVNNPSADAKYGEEEVKITQVTENEEEHVEENEQTVSKVLNFTEESAMVWPLRGELLLDYSMETTTYFKTLDQYKCSKGIVLGAAVGSSVQAAANGKVLSIVENEETGVTVTMDLGNDFYAIYGQLRGLNVKVGDYVEQGTILGCVDEPTKYYVEEGSNLYFAVKKGGTYVDPMLYLETETE